MKQFNIPSRYRSQLIAPLKQRRNAADRMKKDFTPAVLNFGPVQVLLARHFGFCFGVENAIEISHRALEEHPDKNIYLLSQMIHNPVVNADLTDRGMRFIQDTEGNQLISWDEVTSDDIVIVPAFGTTLEIEQLLADKGIETKRYNTTCPFVEKVWKRSAKLGSDGYSVIIHGKEKHEETRATFSHSQSHAASLVIRDMAEAEVVAEYMTGKRELSTFHDTFAGKYSEGFDPKTDLKRIGVVNQTTMLASDTQAIAEFLKQTVIGLYGEDHYKNHFAETRDTLCYATNDNQTATQRLLEERADVALVVGGYNSSNTSHLVDLAAEKLPTYFINGPECLSPERIKHFDYQAKAHRETADWLPTPSPLRIIVTSGASCPDAAVEGVIETVVAYFNGARPAPEVLEHALEALAV